MALRTFDVAPLVPEDVSQFAEHLLAGERVALGYRGESTSVLFTDRRIVTVQLQVVISERIETTSISYRAVRQFSLNRAVSGEGRSEFKILIGSDDHPLHLRAAPGTDFTPLQELLATRLQ
jgi:hypothetical protein